MVKITNGVDVIEVSKGAYESIYKSQGFTEVDSKEEKSEELPHTRIETDEEFNKEQRFIKELEEKPLASWSKSEVKEYCALLGLDISKTKNVTEAKEIVKDFISNR